MGVRALASLIGLIAVGIGIAMVVRDKQEPIEVLKVGRLPEGATHFDLSNTPTYRSQWNVDVHLKSNLNKAVRMSVRLEDPAPAGWRVKLLGRETVAMPGGRIAPTLALFPSRIVGPFTGKVSLYSDDVPDWEYTWTFSGEIVKIPYEGGHLSIVPSGFDLGKAKAGEKRIIRFTLENGGDEPVTVYSIVPEDGRRIGIQGIGRDQLLVPGSRLEVAAELTIPNAVGNVVFRMTLSSSAENAKKREIRALAVVVPDYACNPPQVDWGNVYRRKQPQLDLVITGVKPFKVTQVFSDRLFDTLSLGADELRDRQTVSLRLRRDALIGPVKTTLRLRIEPAGVEAKVPLEMVVTPAIYAGPVNFGRIKPGGAVVKRTVQFYSMDQVPFSVEQATATMFIVEINNRASMTPTLTVYPPRNLGPGLHRDKILVKTDHPDVPELIIPLAIEIR